MLALGAEATDFMFGGFRHSSAPITPACARQARLRCAAPEAHWSRWRTFPKAMAGTTVVAGVTLNLWAGEIWGFVGAKGAGKTTTLRMLAGVLRPDSGAGHVLGFEIQRDAAKIRERVGYMSQRLSLYAELSVFENLRFRSEVYGLRNPHAAVEAAIREFGLVPWAHRRAGSLSGGWARRLQFAASLLHSPHLVLLDEPTAGLDAAARRGMAARGAPAPAPAPAPPAPPAPPRPRGRAAFIASR